MISPAQQENAASVLLTAGYEKSTPQQFLDLLSNYDVEVVVDVRKTPLSRKKGFSKTSSGNSSPVMELIMRILKPLEPQRR